MQSSAHQIRVWINRRARDARRREISTPIASSPNALAAASALPTPQNGSTTVVAPIDATNFTAIGTDSVCDGASKRGGAGARYCRNREGATTDAAVAARFPIALLLLAGALFWGALIGRRRHLAVA